PAKTLVRTYEYDAFGDLHRMVNWGEIDPSSGPLRTPVVNEIDWAEVDQPPIGAIFTPPLRYGWMWRPVARATGDGDAQGKMPRPAPSEKSYEWNRSGLLTKVTASLKGTLPLDRRNGASDVAPTPADASADGPINLAALSYNEFGNPIRIETPNGRCADIGYDPAYQQLPVAGTAWRAGCSSPDPLVTNHDFDRGLAAVTKEVGSDGTVQGAKFDGFGRLLELEQPDAKHLGQLSPFPSATIDWSLADTGPVRKVHTRQISGSGDSPAYAESWMYMDSLGQPLASLSQGDDADSWIATGMTTSSVNGRVLRVFQPQLLSGQDGSAFDLTVPALGASLTYDAEIAPSV